jgi:hypothetical protein
MGLGDGWNSGNRQRYPGEQETNMRKILTTTVLVGFMVASAWAALNFKSGPEFTQSGNTFHLTAEASGQGNTRMIATITVTGLADYDCRNNGGQIVAAQSPAQLSNTGSQNVNSDHNGRSIVDLTVSLVIPATVPGKTVGCPNGNWTGVNPHNVRDLSATGTITFGGAVVFTQTLP